MKITFRRALLACCLAAAFPALAEQVADLDGQAQFPTTAMVAGTRLQLNGAAVRKRGYFKPDAVAIYLPAKATTLDGVVGMKGPKRMQVHVLRELDGATISRYFVNDFKLVSTEEEFKQLINEVAQVGKVYGSLHRVYKGDVILIDWIPGKGIVSTMNGKPLGTPIQSELLFEISLRMGMGANAPADMRDQLLGNRPLKIIEADAAPLPQRTAQVPPT
ncbi:MAG: hypothetical protein EPO01_01180 [Aquabacterium sp.]|jgi:hypothetical protein|nr:MAG: hypothetical protein EPO12_11005 [Aquabacterium sp.]TAL26781.1 MAG: hypothetical protein EPO01_01180 [Aquabacterium sp.]